MQGSGRYCPELPQRSVKRPFVVLAASALGVFAATLILRRLINRDDAPHRFSISSLVNDTADKFEDWHRMPVDRDARMAFINPAQPHVAQVVEALRRKDITEEFLESSVVTVLSNARSIALPDRVGRITARPVEVSMSRYGPYVFWCEVVASTGPEAGKAGLNASMEFLKFSTTFAAASLALSVGLLPDKVSLSSFPQYLLAASWILLTTSLGAGVAVYARLSLRSAIRLDRLRN